MRILFMGRKATGRDALAWTLAEGHDIVGVLTDSHLSGSPTTALAEEHGLPLFTYEEASEEVAAGGLAFDLAVSFVYWRILKDPLLSAPRQGIINFHPAPLPDFKGTAGYNMAILEALDSWAVTAHYVNEGIDTGAIIDRFEFSIDPETETAQSLEKMSMEFMLRLYKKTLRRATRDSGVLSTSSNEGGRYITRGEMEELKWVRPGDDVDRKIRAFWFPPYRGAQVEIDGTPYTLVNDEILATLAPEGVTSLHARPRRP
jgi:methionyl-tRNA formyltransferase